MLLECVGAGRGGYHIGCCQGGKKRQELAAANAVYDHQGRFDALYPRAYGTR